MTKKFLVRKYLKLWEVYQETTDNYGQVTITTGFGGFSLKSVAKDEAKRLQRIEDKSVEHKIEESCKTLTKNGFVVCMGTKHIKTTMQYTLSDAVTSAAFFLMDRGYSLPAGLDFEGRAGK